MIGLKVRSVGKSFVGCSLAGKWRIPCVSISCISRKITNTFHFVVLSSHTSYVHLHLATWQKRFFAFLSFHSCTNIFILFKNVRYIPFVSIQVASMLLFVWKAKNNVSFSDVSDLKCYISLNVHFHFVTFTYGEQGDAPLGYYPKRGVFGPPKTGFGYSPMGL